MLVCSKITYDVYVGFCFRRALSINNTQLIQKGAFDSQKHLFYLNLQAIAITNSKTTLKGGTAKQIVRAYLEKVCQFVQHNHVGESVSRFVLRNRRTIDAQRLCKSGLRQSFFFSQFRNSNTQKFYSLYVCVCFHN